MLHTYLCQSYKISVFRIQISHFRFFVFGETDVGGGFVSLAVLGYAGKVVGDAAYDAQAGEGDTDAVAGFVQGGVLFEEGEDGDDACDVEVSKHIRKHRGEKWKEKKEKVKGIRGG